VVDVDAGHAGRRHEGRIGQRGAAVVGPVPRHLEVDQHQAAVRPDQHVGRMEVADDDAALVDGRDGPLQPADHVEHPLGVGGQAVGLDLVGREGVAQDDLARQRLAVDEVEHQEVVAGHHHVVPHGRDGVESGQAAKGVPLPQEAGHCVGSVGVQPRMGPGLLEDHLLPRALVHAGVEAAPVGEVDGPLDAVGQVLHRLVGPGCQMGLQAGRDLGPRRWAEGGSAMVRNKLAIGANDGQFQGAGGAEAVALGHAAVPYVQRPVAPSQITQDVGPGLARHSVAQLVQDGGELGLVRGVDRDELAAGTAVGVLGIPQQQALEAADELERNAARDAVVGDLGQDLLGVVEAGRRVDFPALGRDARLLRPVDQPVVRDPPLPAVRHGPLGEREVHVVAPGDGVGVIEQRVGKAELLVAMLHRASSPRGRRHTPPADGMHPSPSPPSPWPAVKKSAEGQGPLCSQASVPL
jgi:hypothetical protein